MPPLPGISSYSISVVLIDDGDGDGNGDGDGEFNSIHRFDSDSEGSIRSDSEVDSEFD